MQRNGKVKYASAEDGGTQVVLEGVAASSDWRSRWTRLELLLAGLCILLAMIILILVFILAASNLQTRQNSTNGFPDDRTAKLLHSQSDLLSTSRPHDYRHSYSVSRLEPGHGGLTPEIGLGGEHLLSDAVCLTEGCVKAASRLLTGMDSTVDPCEDFFEFACGNWNKLNIIPEDRSSYNTFSKLIDDVNGMVKDLLEEPVSDKDTAVTKKSKDLYASCLNETQLDLQGLGPMKQLLDEFGGWPVVMGSMWQPGRVDLMDLIVKLRHSNHKVLIYQGVGADDKNSGVNIIQLDQPDLGMPSPDYYLKTEGGPAFLDVYEKYARDVAVMFGANESIALHDTHNMIELEIKLANITVPETERRDNEKMYNRMTIQQLNDLIPKFDWLMYLQKIFDPVNIKINVTENIIVCAPGYLQNMVQILQDTDKRVMVNYLIWRVMMERIISLPQKYRSIKKDYDKSLFGSEMETSRWRECVSYVNENMGNAVGRLFVEKHFDETSKSMALEMIHNIRDAFYELVNETEWMDETTRILAREKAEAVAEKIGYADSILNNTVLNEEYNDVTFSKDNYFGNVLAVTRYVASSNLKKLRDPVDRTKWSTTPAVVNAFYSSTKNQIMFPAAILQPPFYSKEFPKSLNYGGIGMVIGHEITHGFDDKGRQYDKDGNLVQWWHDNVIQKFKERAQCIIDQYSNYTVPQVNIQINGIHTQGENIADNGGIKQAYQAYRKWVEKQGKEEPRLPGMQNYTNNQLFFINFAQMWCGTLRPEAAVNKIRIGVHSPGRFRVIGTLQNNDKFSEAFHCAETSYMNPRRKCSVW